jgi:hypothetical protein
LQNLQPIAAKYVEPHQLRPPGIAVMSTGNAVMSTGNAVMSTRIVFRSASQRRALIGQSRGMVQPNNKYKNKNKNKIKGMVAAELNSRIKACNRHGCEIADCCQTPACGM